MLDIETPNGINSGNSNKISIQLTCPLVDGASNLVGAWSGTDASYPSTTSFSAKTVLDQYNVKQIKLDNLDNKLLALIKYRTSLVKEVLKLKEFKKEIVDQKRINFILNKIKGKSKKLKIDPKITNRIWKNMIWSYIDYERRNFKKK